jgi:hypothetical protein
MRPRYMTTQEVADFLGMAYDNARKLLADAAPAQTVGRNRLWTRREVERAARVQGYTNVVERTCNHGRTCNEVDHQRIVWRKLS